MITFLVTQTVEEIYKISSIALSPNVPAQIFVSSFLVTFGYKMVSFLKLNDFCLSCVQMGLMVSPPKPGDISYDQFVSERYVIF